MLQPIGEHLQAAGLMTAADVEAVLGVQRVEGGRFCSIALRRGLCSERELVNTLARQLRVPGVCVEDIAADGPAQNLVPHELRERLGVQPDRVSARSVTMLMRDPHDTSAVSELRRYTDLTVRPSVALEAPLMAFIRRHRSMSPTMSSPPAVVDTRPLEAEALARPLPQQSLPAFSTVVAVENVGPKVMVAGFREGAAGSLGEALQGQGYAVLATPSAGELLDRLHRHRPAALLLGDAIPIVRRLEVCRRVKGHRDLRHIKVVLVTGEFRGWRARADFMTQYGVDEVIDATEERVYATQLVARLVGGTVASNSEERDVAAAAHLAFEDGLVALRVDGPEQALEAFSKSASLDPTNPRPHFYRARIHDESGRAFEALAAYEEAVRLDPTYLRALKALALLQERHGLEHQAADTWERALSVCRDRTTRRAIRGHLMRLLR